MKPSQSEEAQLAPCRWEDCGEEIACDRRSVSQHMQRHIQDLCARGLVLKDGGDEFKGPAHWKALSKCQTYCRWRDEVPCSYSDLYQSRTHGALLRARQKKVQKLFGRGSRKKDWGRNARSGLSSEEPDSENDGVEVELEGKPGPAQLGDEVWEMR